MPVALSKQERQGLKARAHPLDPVVMVGKEGVTDAVLAQAAEQVRAHELIKVKLLQTCPTDKHEAASQLSVGADAALVQVIGKTVVLYKPRPPDEKKKPATSKAK